MYIGNHFRKRRVPVAGLQKRISFLPARRGASRKTISRVCFSSFRFFGRNFDVRSSMPARSFIRSLNTCEHFAARALPAATFSRDTGNFFTSHANWIPFWFYRWFDPNVTARDGLSRISRFSQDNSRSLQKISPKAWSRISSVQKIVFEENASKGNRTRNVEDICIYKKKGS